MLMLFAQCGFAKTQKEVVSELRNKSLVYASDDNLLYRQFKNSSISAIYIKIAIITVCY